MSISVKCPHCGATRGIQEADRGSVVKCFKCRQSFTPPKVEAEKPQKIAKSHSHGKQLSVIQKAVRLLQTDLNPLKKKLPQYPSEGALTCPYCSHEIAQNVQYLGQSVTCPKCHANFNAPHKDGPTGSPEYKREMAKAQEHMTVAWANLIYVLLIIFFWWTFDFWWELIRLNSQ